MSQSPNTIYLKDYQVPPFIIKKTDLLIQIFDDSTVVTANLQVKRNPEYPDQTVPLVLDGQDLNTISISIDGHEQFVDKDFVIDGEQLTLANVPDSFKLLTVVSIDPVNNTSLEGLYKSNGMYCTQCEAQGFRKITWYLDRPDAMSKFTTRIEADRETFPILLSNGNIIAQGELAGDRHFFTWKDPFAKPCYLFALVAGKLVCAADRFVTRSGKEVRLELFVEAHNANKTRFALDSLKRAMTWDEERFGREYDLDIYMIVAVDHFNMGAMENKGLNIFNSACVLADMLTTTDAGFERIESIIGHEYFHNWSGNRVTCRDWFQLSLKEGFTVYRDSEFTADLHSRPVKRINDVNLLKTMQFVEDAGPMAHPIRPQSYMEINNFYTLTVYEKGAEVVGMLNTLLGNELFRQGSDLYFERFDGQAVTTEDFVACMAEVSGLDLSQFQHWYDQAGTPLVEVTDQYDAKTGKYSLKFKQSCGKGNTKAFLIPIKLGLLDANGKDVKPFTTDAAFNAKTGVFSLTKAEQSIEFTGFKAQPLPSLLRDFSAPVNLKYAYSNEQLAFLLQHDSNEFNRWNAGQTLAMNLLEADIDSVLQGKTLSDTNSQLLTPLFKAIIDDQSLDGAMKAALLTLPSEASIAANAKTIEPLVIAQVRDALVTQLATALQADWQALYAANTSNAPYKFEFSDVAQRCIKNLALSYWVKSNDAAALETVVTQYHKSLNQTDRRAAMVIIFAQPQPELHKTIADDFWLEWSGDTQMMEQWLALQAEANSATIASIQTLMKHKTFDMGNPNKVRSVIGGFCMRNPRNFHAIDGSGYQFLADQVIELNSKNPQIASRLVTPLTQWQRYNAKTQASMKAELERIKEQKLSPDLFEVVSKSLANS